MADMLEIEKQRNFPHLRGQTVVFLKLNVVANLEQSFTLAREESHVILISPEASRRGTECESMRDASACFKFAQLFLLMYMRARSMPALLQQVSKHIYAYDTSSTHIIESIFNIK
jgi:hypothetical protein